MFNIHHYVLFPVYLVNCFYISGVWDPLWIPLTDLLEKEQGENYVYFFIHFPSFWERKYEKLFSMHTPITRYPFLIIFVSGLIIPLISQLKWEIGTILGLNAFFLYNTIFTLENICRNLLTTKLKILCPPWEHKELNLKDNS